MEHECASHASAGRSIVKHTQRLNRTGSHLKHFRVIALVENPAGIAAQKLRQILKSLPSMQQEIWEQVEARLVGFHRMGQDLSSKSLTLVDKTRYWVPIYLANLLEPIAPGEFDRFLFLPNSVSTRRYLLDFAGRGIPLAHISSLNLEASYYLGFKALQPPAQRLLYFLPRPTALCTMERLCLHK